MKEVLVSIDKAGRIVLPKSILKELAIHSGDLLKVSVQGKSVRLQPNDETVGLVRRGQSLIFSSGGESILEKEVVDAVLHEDREGCQSGVHRQHVPRKR